MDLSLGLNDLRMETRNYKFRAQQYSHARVPKHPDGLARDSHLAEIQCGSSAAEDAAIPILSI
jgi:hypothetical protein